MDGSGNVTDTEPAYDGRLLRRHQAVLVDDSDAATGDLATVWRELASGAAKVDDSFACGDRSYLVLREITAEERADFPASKLAALECVIAGGGLKPAMDALGRTQSTIAVDVKHALSFIGVRCALSRTPALLIQSAKATHGLYVVARRTRFQHAGERFQVVSTRRPEVAIAPLLSPGEREVVSRFLEGESYDEIARNRGRSIRTVANQLSTVFRKVRVSGRLELVGHLTLLAACHEDLRSSA